MSYFTPDKHPDPRIRYSLTSPGSGALDWLRAARLITRAASQLPPVDWLHARDPDAASVATRLAGVRGGRVIFDVHEIFHGALLDRWLHGRQLSFVRDLVRRRISHTCAAADIVIGVSRSVLEPYCARARNCLVVRNSAPLWFADESVPVPSARFMEGDAR